MICTISTYIQASPAAQVYLTIMRNTLYAQVHDSDLRNVNNIPWLCLTMLVKILAFSWRREHSRESRQSLTPLRSGSFAHFYHCTSLDKGSYSSNCLASLRLVEGWCGGVGETFGFTIRSITVGINTVVRITRQRRNQRRRDRRGYKIAPALLADNFLGSLV